MRSTSVGDTEMLQPVAGTKAATIAKDRKGVVDAHRATLGALYHVSVPFPSLWTIEDSYLIHLTCTAEFYDCGAIVRAQINSYLRKESQRKSILAHCEIHPYEMVSLGFGVEADWIVQEAAIFIIHKSAYSWRQYRADFDRLPGSLAGIMLRKRELFKQRLKDIDFALLRMQPLESSWQHRFAISHFRQWFSKQIDESYTSELNVNHGRPYRLIACSEPPHLLTPKDFSDLCGASSSALPLEWNKVAQAWKDTFAIARKIVRPLLVDATIRKGYLHEFRDLRFIAIADNELPWKQKK